MNQSVDKIRSWLKMRFLSEIKLSTRVDKRIRFCSWWGKIACRRLRRGRWWGKSLGCCKWKLMRIRVSWWIRLGFWSVIINNRWVRFRLNEDHQSTQFYKKKNNYDQNAYSKNASNTNKTPNAAPTTPPSNNPTNSSPNAKPATSASASAKTQNKLKQSARTSCEQSNATPQKTASNSDPSTSTSRTPLILEWTRWSCNDQPRKDQHLFTRITLKTERRVCLEIGRAHVWTPVT